MPAGLTLRSATDEDSWGVVALIGACWSEYPGCVMDVHGECPDLLAPATSYRDLGGEFWVLTDPCSTVGACGGWRPLGPSAVELERLYVAPRHRRAGVARRLAAMVESAARERGASEIELWSDTRFVDAHAFYERFGFARSGRTRDLGDLSATTEFHFVKRLSPE